MNITKESEDIKVILLDTKDIRKSYSSKYIKKISKWWNKQDKKIKCGLTFTHIDERRSYKGLTFKEIETIYKYYNKD